MPDLAILPLIESIFRLKFLIGFHCSKNLVVVLSGIVEIALGLTLLLWKKQRVNIGWALAIFFILVFPGNVAQYLDGKDAFGVLNSDSARLIRLFFQPLLIAWALWSSGAWQSWRNTNK